MNSGICEERFTKDWNNCKASPAGVAPSGLNGSPPAHEIPGVAGAIDVSPLQGFSTIDTALSAYRCAEGYRYAVSDAIVDILDIQMEKCSDIVDGAGMPGKYILQQSPEGAIHL